MQRVYCEVYIFNLISCHIMAYCLNSTCSPKTADLYKRISTVFGDDFSTECQLTKLPMGLRSASNGFTSKTFVSFWSLKEDHLFMILHANKYRVKSGKNLCLQHSLLCKLWST